MSEKIRGFEPVAPQHMKNTSKVITEATPKKREDGNWIGDVQLPTRADKKSAGYDIYAPVDITLLPAQKLLVWSDIKSFMQDGEVLMILPRSSMGIKKGLMLSNTMGVIDASYYGNEGNDGNIGLSLLNTSGKAIKIEAGERIVQGVFVPYLVADGDEASGTRTGGIGSTGA